MFGWIYPIGKPDFQPATIVHLTAMITSYFGCSCGMLWSPQSVIDCMFFVASMSGLLVYYLPTKVPSGTVVDVKCKEGAFQVLYLS